MRPVFLMFGIGLVLTGLQPTVGSAQHPVESTRVGEQRRLWLDAGVGGRFARPLGVNAAARVEFMRPSNRLGIQLEGGASFWTLTREQVPADWRRTTVHGGVLTQIGLTARPRPLVPVLLTGLGAYRDGGTAAGLGWSVGAMFPLANPTSRVVPSLFIRNHSYPRRLEDAGRTRWTTISLSLGTW
jgi:hypothetical protein